MNGFAAVFSSLPDPRRPNARRHQLLDILVIAFCACLCGAESCVDRADFAEAKEDVLREFLDLEGGPPSHDTFRRVFRMLDPARFAACFQAYLDGWGRSAEDMWPWTARPYVAPTTGSSEPRRCRWSAPLPRKPG